MKHTECKDCKFRDGDCGHHFKMDGKTNYDIASLTCCDRYGNCEFFKQKEYTINNETIISVLQAMLKDMCKDCGGCKDGCLDYQVLEYLIKEKGGTE